MDIRYSGFSSVAVHDLFPSAPRTRLHRYRLTAPHHLLKPTAEASPKAVREGRHSDIPIWGCPVLTEGAAQ